MCNRQSWAHIYVPILIGGLIYTLFRVETLLVFKIFEIFQIDKFLNNLRIVTLAWEIPSFVKYSLPDGLWVYAFTYYLVSIWIFDEKIGMQKYFIMAIPLFLGGGSEIMQIFFYEIGTFDFYDLFISFFAFFAGYKAVKQTKTDLQGEMEYG